jgi:hypothetical protein
MRSTRRCIEDARDYQEFAAAGRYHNHTMPPKSSAAARRTTASRRKADTIEIVVRRGALRRFDALKTRTGELPVVVTWDRRTDDRRDDGQGLSPRERRQIERRKKPPFTWDLADFVVVERPPAARKSRKKSTRKP